MFKFKKFKKCLLSIVVVVIVAIAVVNVNIGFTKNSNVSDLMLANIEALARNEYGPCVCSGSHCETSNGGFFTCCGMTMTDCYWGYYWIFGVHNHVCGNC